MEEEALKRQKGSFSAISSFYQAKDEKPEFQKLFKDLKKAQVRTWELECHRGGQCSTLHSVFNKWKPNHAFTFGDNAVGVSTKHSMAIVHTYHFFDHPALFPTVL